MKTQQGAYPIQRQRPQPPSVARASRKVPKPPPVVYEDELEDDDSYYETRPPTSSIRRYAPPQQPHVIQRGHRRLVIHPEPPPRRQYHWLTYVGLTMVVLLSFWLLWSIGTVWWQGKQDDWKYGMPRTFQADANVGHGTSQVPDSHFIAVNLAGNIQVIEEPANDASRSKIFAITTLNSGDGTIPVTVSFRDLNADGKLDMVITIGDPGQQVSMFLFNNGTTFVSKL
jgi:hypothetical protein